MNAKIQNNILKKIDYVINNGKCNCWSLNEKLDCLLQLSQFSMGRDLLLSGTISSHWIDYLVNGEMVSSDSEIYKNPAQELLEQKSFLISSWKEIYQMFIKWEQKQIKNDCVLASIPCGFMRDFFKLDFSEITNFRLVGIDLDQKVTKKALELSRCYGFRKKTTTHCCNALNLPFKEEFHLISSCGLNIYLSNNKQLYQNFFKALKFSGTLLLHFLTLPPFLSAKSNWKIDKMDKSTQFFDIFLLQDILNFPYHSYTTTNDIIKQLENVGFKEVKIQLDSYGIGGIAIAKKLLNHSKV